MILDIGGWILEEKLPPDSCLAGHGRARASPWWSIYPHASSTCNCPNQSIFCSKRFMTLIPPASAGSHQESLLVRSIDKVLPIMNKLWPWVWPCRWTISVTGYSSLTYPKKLTDQHP
ncbi:MAG: hypothetical protein IPH35_18380 [Rhodoferax sp.]|nr:hypothetical protein [Rhodoferax sp.]